MNLFNELQLKTKELDVSIKSLRQSGTNYAQAERDYKVLLRQECLKLRDDGMAIFNYWNCNSCFICAYSNRRTRTNIER